MASRLLNLLNEMEDGRQQCVKSLQDSGVDIPNNASYETIAKNMGGLLPVKTDLSEMAYWTGAIDGLPTLTIDPDRIDWNNFFYNYPFKNLSLTGEFNENVYTYDGMFSNSINLNEINMSQMKTSNCMGLNSIFANCSTLLGSEIQKVINSWNTSNCQSFSSLFGGCYQLGTIDVSHFNMSNAQNIESIFNSTKLDTQPVGINDWDLSNLTYCAYAFAYVTSSSDGVLELTLDKWGAPKIQSCYGMFMSSNAYKKIDLRNFKFNDETNSCGAMFNSCQFLEYLDIRSMNLSEHYEHMDFGGMFDGVPSDCLIIVRDDNEKDFILNNWSFLENVKTVSEYESEA